MEGLYSRQSKELQELQENIKQMLKKAKKSERAEMEAKAMQMEFDLKAKHREEEDELEIVLASGDLSAVNIESVPVESESTQSNAEDKEKESIEKKKEKAKKKKDKRQEKEKEREATKQHIAEVAALTIEQSPREVELKALLQKLNEAGLRIVDIPSDGHCMYRAICSQLPSTMRHDVASLRRLVSQHMQSHSEDYAPFLGLDTEAFTAYCDTISDITKAEWGGQVELRAATEALGVIIQVYSADSPVLVMSNSHSDHSDNDSSGGNTVVRLSYHRYLYSLGEHYNALIQAK